MKTKWLVHLCILLLCSVEDGKRKTVALWKICDSYIAGRNIFPKRKNV